MTGLGRTCSMIWAMVALAPAVLGGQTVTLQSLDAKNLRLALPSGLVRSLPSQGSIHLASNTLLIGETARWPNLEVSAIRKGSLELPYRIYTSGVNQVQELRAVVETDQAGIRLDTTDGKYHGTLRIGVIDVASPNAAHAILPGISFLVTSDEAGTNPSFLQNIVSTFDFRQVRLDTVSAKNAISVKIRPSFAQNDPIEWTVPIQRGALALSASPARINGFGLQTTMVTVQADGVPHPEGLELTVHSRQGILQQTSVRPDRNGTATVTLRSVGVGTDWLDATAIGMNKAETLPVEFAFPWFFLAAAVLGGLVGSGTRVALTRSPPLGRVFLRLAAGVGIGVLAASASTLGVNLAGIDVPATISGAEAAPFVLAGVASYIGKLNVPA